MRQGIMGNKSSHDFTKSRSVSFDTPLSRPWGKKSSDTSAMSRPYSLATRSPDLSSRSYNSKALDNSRRARSLGSLNTPGISYSTAPRPSPATNSGLSRQSSNQSTVHSRPTSATLTRQTSSQTAMSRQTSSQLSTPRQYSDAYLTDDLKKLYKSHDKSKAQALVDDIDPHDTSAQTLDRKLNALKNQRYQDNPAESKSSNGTIPRKSKKTKAPPAPQSTVATLPRDTTKTTAPVTNGKVKAKKKSAPVPPSQKYEYVEPLPPPPPPPLPPTTAPPTIIEPSASPKSNDNNNNNNTNSGAIKQTQVETSLSTAIQTPIQTTPSPAVEHPLVPTTPSQPAQANTNLPTKITAPKRRSKTAPLRPPSPTTSPKVPSTLELELDSADDFIKAISPKSEQKEVSIQCDIPLEQKSKGTEEHYPSTKFELDKEKTSEEPGDILKLYIDKNAVKESQRSPDESSPITECEPDEAQKRKQHVIELDDILVQTDEMSKPALPNHKELKTITLENIDTNSITTENSDSQENRPYDEDLLTPRPEVGFSEDRFPDPPIMQTDMVPSAIVTVENESIQANSTINVETQQQATEKIDTASKENKPLDSPDHPLQTSETSEPASHQEIEVTIPQQEASIISTSATVSPNSNNSELDQQIHSPSQSNESSEKTRKKKKKSRSLSMLGKSMKSFVSSLGRSSNKASTAAAVERRSDVGEPELELANDNWVFSPKGAVKPVSRPNYNPAWVEETFKRPDPDPEPTPQDIEAQIDNIMVAVVDLSDNEKYDDQPEQAADVVVEKTTVLHTIQIDSTENGGTVEIATIDQTEKPTTNDKISIDEPKEDTDQVDETDHNSTIPKSPHGADDSETASTEESSKVENLLQPLVLTNGVLPHQPESENLNGKEISRSENTENANNIPADPDTTTEHRATAVQEEGSDDVMYRAKPATVVYRAEPAVIMDNKEELAGDGAPRHNSTASTPPRPTIQNRSSLVFMTPKGYGATSSKYRPIDKTQLSSTGTA